MRQKLVYFCLTFFITAIPADVGHFITNKWRLNRGFYHNFILANN